MVDISAVVLTKNEEKNLPDCLKSLKFCKEIIIIDDKSVDKTREIAKKAGAKIYIHETSGNFAQQRNFGLEKANSKWVIFIDADERVSANLQQEIEKIVSTPNLPVLAYYIKREDILWNKQLKHGETGDIKLIRMARKSAGQWTRSVHETWKVNGRVGEMKNPLVHYPHQTLREYIDHINNWSTLHAEANMQEGKRSNLLKIIFYPKGKFFRNYIFKRGYLDGTEGFISALLMSLHSFLSWSKLWILQRK